MIEWINGPYFSFLKLDGVVVFSITGPPFSEKFIVRKFDREVVDSGPVEVKQFIAEKDARDWCEANALLIHLHTWFTLRWAGLIQRHRNPGGTTSV